MNQRGRKSAARMSVVQIDCQARRPPAPKELTANQARTWDAIVASCPGGWFTVAQEPLLTAYCRHVATSNGLAGMIDKSKLDPSDRASLVRFDKLLAMRDRETKAICALSRAMRLTQQSRMHPRSAGRAMEGAPNRRLWDDLPWEDT